MASELNVLIRVAETHGYTVTRSKKGHWIFRNPDGRRVATAVGSGSDARALKNTAAHLRAAGLPIPHKGGRTTKRGTTR